MVDMAQQQRHDITKYPNRRFYNGTTSTHATLSDLYEIVRRGGEIVVTDKESGRDITNVVLTQIILEHDPPKMELFPSALLHQAIQANESAMRRFIDQYFAQAMNAFSQSRSRFDQFLQGTTMGSVGPFDWARMMMPVMGSSVREDGGTSRDQPEATGNESPSNRDDAPTDSARRAHNADDLDVVRRQLADMQAELASMKEGQSHSSNRASNKKRSKKTGAGSGSKIRAKKKKKRSKK